MNRQVNAPILFWDKKGFVISDLKFKLNGSLSFSGVFSMDEDSLSRDCEPFFESDGGGGEHWWWIIIIIINIF